MMKLCTQRVLLLVLGLTLFFSFNAYAQQVTLTATGGTPNGSFATLNDAFAAINAGTHTGTIDISINANTTEPATPTALAASGQGAAVYTAITIRPTAVVTVAGPTVTGRGTIELDGADNVTIDGSIVPASGNRDLTIQNTAAITVTATAVVRYIGRTTLGLGVNNCAIRNCNIIGNTPGNSGSSGSTSTSSMGIYAGSATGITATGTGADYDNLTIENNVVKSCWIGILVMSGTTTQSDNLIVRNNLIGSTNPLEQVSFRGITLQQIVNGLVEGNTVFSMLINTTNSNAGIEVYGSATTGTIIRRNKISDIKSVSTSGYGAYGINITSGVGTEITNNVIHGVATTNYNSTSTTFQAFGIRITGGTGHKIYYNSVHMYGDYSTGSTTNARSGAFVVTSTAVTGLEIRNNIFSNKMTSSTASTPEFYAIMFPASYNFLNANINNNAYFVSNTALHHVGKIGVTFGSGNYSTVPDWALISQVNNATNDVNSQPIAGNSIAPFTTDINLRIPAATSTPVESGGVAIAALGLPNVDHDGVNRPAGTGSAPDMGAYEFEGATGGDFVAPTLASLNATPTAVQCTPTARSLTVNAMDNVGVTSVLLYYSYNGVPQTPINMTMTAGTATNGTWSGTLPAAPSNNVNVTYYVEAADAAANTSASLSGNPYRDAYLVVTASPNQTINQNTTTQVWATTNDPARQKVVISEIIQFKSGTGDGPYPAYIPTADNDFVELTNISNVAVAMGGFTMTLVGGVNGSFTIPAGFVLAPNAVMTLAFSGTANDPANNYFGMGLGTTSSAVAMGYILKNAAGAIIDVVGTNSYVFAGATGVTPADWSGNIASSSGLAGVRRTGSDTNNAADWSLSSAANLTNIGLFNTGLNTITVSSTFSWAPTGGTTDTIVVGPYATPGVYSHTVTYSDGTCNASSVVDITVQAPTIPVADFVAAPLAVGTFQTVNFTDLSTNIPTNWTWAISPATYSFVNSTSATSQNPQVQFSAAGVYSVTLTAGNSAGSDDEVKLSYVTVTLSYCASSANNAADTDIGNVTFGSINNGTATPTLSNGTATATYTDFTGLAPATVQQGATYPFSMSQITSGATFYAAYMNVFIDFNQDGVFDPSTERVLSAGPTSGAAPTLNGNITIPAGATLGITRMRVILTEGGSITDPPCGPYGYGETEDYRVDITAGTACTGAPASSNTLASVSSACSGTPVNLSLDVLYSAIGITYQWQSSADGVSYSNIVGATNATHAATQSSATYYQAIVSCSNSGMSITSTPVQVLQNSFLSCYCTITATNTADTDIGNVTFGLLNNGNPLPTLSNATAIETYSNFTGLTPVDFQAGDTYSISIDQITSGGTFYAAHANVFIDYNQDGILDPTTERVFTAGPTSGAAPNVTGSVTIPGNATAGITLMRVILREGGDATSPPCESFGYGEVEDYYINILPCVVAAPTTVGDTLCSGDFATVTATGTGTINWYDAATAGNLLGSGNSFTSPAPLTSSFTIYAENNTACGASVRVATDILVVSPGTATSSSNNATCNAANNGTASVSMTGGMAPYSYLWSNAATTQNVSGLAPNTYTVSVTDYAGCVANASVTITEPTAITATASGTNPSCAGVASGTVTATVSGGTAPYTFMWSNGATTQNLAAVAAGTYMATVTDANACTSMISAVTISDPAGMTLTNTSINATCNGNTNGSIDLTVSGGVAPYTFMWSNGATTEDLSGLAAATYSVTVNDNNGCPMMTSMTITEPTVITATPVLSNVRCNGGSDGSIDLTVSGGTAPYTFMWSNAATTEDLVGLAAGTYTVTVMDANACAITASGSITQPAALASTFTATMVSCNGQSTGSIDFTVSGGTAPYTYMWSNAATTEDLAALPAGSYTATVTDANTCSMVAAAIVITEPTAIVLSNVVTNETAVAANDGAIDLTVSGGTAPYTYMWSNAATTQDLVSLTGGSYTVTVTDALGCEMTQTITVSTITAVPVVANASIRLMPNPSTGLAYLKVELTEGQEVRVDVFAINGQLVQQLQPQFNNSQLHAIDLSDYPDGTYMVRVILGNEVQTHKLILTRN